MGINSHVRNLFCLLSYTIKPPVLNRSLSDKAGFDKNDENPVLMRVTELYYPFTYESLPSANTTASLSKLNPAIPD